jgi:hypothetical protein
MNGYWSVVSERDGHRLLLVYERLADGSEIVVGYAIQRPDRDELAFFSHEVGFFNNLNEAIEEFERTTNHLKRTLTSP